MARALTKHPSHLFTTWLNYRSAVYGETKADVLRWVNAKYDKTYTTSRFWEYSSMKLVPPNYLLHKIVEEDYYDMLDWKMKELGITQNKKLIAELIQAFKSTNYRD